MFDVRTYKPAGPTLARFHASSAFYRVMAGPVGSGKTAGCGCVEMALGAMIQRPFPDGVRRAKFGVLRDTYRNLYSQFLPSWWEWFPKDFGNFVGSDDRPAMHTFSIEDAPLIDDRGRIVGAGPCEIQVEMRALGTNSVEGTCRGWNLTGVFLDEADLMPEDAFSYLAGRAKRWPQKPYRVTKGVWATFNKPDVDHYMYRRCVEEPSSDWEFFDQPGGLVPGTMITNPAAENLERLDDDYYQIQAKSNPDWYVTRMVRNEWGASVAGERIYPEFRATGEAAHMSPVELEPAPGSDIVLGFDGGGTPAAVIVGREKLGRRICYGEVVLTDPADPTHRRLLTGVGPKRFAAALKDALWPRFRACRITIGYGDPSMWYGADREAGEFSSIETIGQQLDLAVSPAPSNEIAIRLEAVRGLFGPGLDGRPQLIVNPSCRHLRRGFVSDYKWTERDPKQPAKKLVPQKTATSHVHDALQYALLGDQGRAGVTGGRAYDRDQPKSSVSGWTQSSSGLLLPPGAQGAPTSPSYASDFDLWGD